MERTEHIPRPHPNLERDKVVTVALVLLNEVGCDGLTVRRLADKLGVKAAALYWHFKNKQDLIDELAIRMLAEEFVEIRAASIDIESKAAWSWQEVLTRMGEGMRQALLRYRDGSLVLAHADFSKGLFKEREKVINLLCARGFTEDAAIHAMFTVSRFTLGCVFEEQADPRNRNPELGGPLYDVDAVFVSGLSIVLDGIASQLSSRP